MKTLRKRSLILTGYLELLLIKHFSGGKKPIKSNFIILNIIIFFKFEANSIEYITPTNPEERGSQISVRFSKNVKDVHLELEKRGVVVSLFKFLLYLQN
jgi:kynureninase